jgi:hypothetical protein
MRQEPSLRTTLIGLLVVLSDEGKGPSRIGYNVHNCHPEDKDLSMGAVLMKKIQRMLGGTSCSGVYPKRVMATLRGQERRCHSGF